MYGFARTRAILATGLVAILVADRSFAAEVDNFSYRPASLTDRTATDALNSMTESRLRQAAATANESGSAPCDLRTLHMAVLDGLGGGEVGKLEYWAIRDASVAKVVVPYNASIYSEAGIMTGSMGLAAMGIVPSFGLAGHYVGADKLGHFFSQGYEYYEAVFVRQVPVQQVIENLGLDDERGINGMAGNGILSYADMAANFSGYLFWRDVAEGSRPYYVCDAGRWARTAREFDWAEYANDAWDEALNCSEYKPSVDESVSEALGSLGLSCPVREEACAEMLALPCGYSFLSAECVEVLGYSPGRDERCQALLVTDELRSQTPVYEQSLMRAKTARMTGELLDGAGTLVRMHGSQAKDRILDKLKKTLKF